MSEADSKPISDSNEKKISMEELKQHNSHEDLWLLIDGKEAGKDATEAFEDVGHSEDARALLGPMLVGEIEGGTQKIKTTSGAVTNENNTNVNSHPVFMFIPVMILGAYLAYKYVS
ncbi:probable cytochrome b5 [Ustilago bromivora]|uniref:Probable cytochrome b5 n=1 Tax=Ustilago bromivora TaxID=307758 RepID=A0A8H8QPJ3_9BASI|nr:probable cytochrome b5 [Ustilago bromivora]